MKVRNKLIRFPNSYFTAIMKHTGGRLISKDGYIDSDKVIRIMNTSNYNYELIDKDNPFINPSKGVKVYYVQD